MLLHAANNRIDDDWATILTDLAAVNRGLIENLFVVVTKADIVRTGAELGVDFALTHSCYGPSAAGGACGHCDSCVLRRRGFEEANVADPTRYAAS